ALQPVITQRLLEASRKRLIGRIERERKSRVILLVHRQETMSLLGFPVFRYIDVDDSEEVIRAIHLTDPEPAPLTGLFFRPRRSLDIFTRCLWIDSCLDRATTNVVLQLILLH